MNRRTAFSLVGILTLGLALRILFLTEFRGTYLLSPMLDAKCYLDWATRIATQDFWGHGVFFQAPLYPYLMGIFFKAFGIHPIAWIAVQYSMTLATGLLVFALARRFFGTPEALLAMSLVVIYPVLIYFDHLLLKTPLTIFLATALLFLTERAADSDSSWTWAGAAGFITGLATLNNESLLAVIPFALFYVIFKRRVRLKVWKPSLVRAAVFALAVSFPLAASLVRNHVKTGDWVLITNQGGVNFWIGNNPAADGAESRPPELALRASSQFEAKEFRERAEEASGKALSPSEVSSYWYRKGFQFISEHPRRFLELTARKIALLGTAVEIPDNYNFRAFHDRSHLLKFLPFGFGTLLALAVAGTYLARKWAARLFFPLTFAGVQIVLLALYHVNSRYRMVLFPVLALLAAHGVTGLTQAIRQRRFGETAAALFLAILAFSFSRLPLYGIDTSVDTYQEAIFEIGQGRLDRAETLLLETVKRNDRNAPAWTALGMIDLKRDRPAVALDHLNRSYELNPYLVGTLNNRGAALAGLGRFNEAGGMFREALRYDAESATALYNLALLSARERRYSEALGFLARIVDSDTQARELKKKLLEAEGKP
ncbi:MAG: glycosyltransferase family 39 protein [Pseudomonadota bacterium]